MKEEFYLEIESLVSGDDKRELCKLLSIEDKFTQRKQYDEYYFQNGIYEGYWTEIIDLVKKFTVEIYDTNIKIKND